MEETKNKVYEQPETARPEGSNGGNESMIYGNGNDTGANGGAGNIGAGIYSAGAKVKEAGPRWVLGKLVMGIFSLILFVLISFQSCAAGISNALSDNGEIGGSAGLICALNFLITGIIAIAARKSGKKSPMIVSAVLLWLNLFYAKAMGGSYSDLEIWGYLSFIFGTVYLLSVMRTKKQVIISVVTAILVCLLFSAIGGSSESTSGSKSENKGAAQSGAASGPVSIDTGTGQDEDSDSQADADGQTPDSDSQAYTDGQTQDGQTQDGQTQDGQTPDGQTQDGQTQDGQTQDGQTQDGQTQDSGSQADADGQTPDSGSQAAAGVQGANWSVGEGRVINYTDSIGSEWIQIAVPVKNTGSVNLYLSSGTIDLEDADGHLVDSKSLVSVYPEVIMPGETAWYYEETLLDSSPSSALSAVPHVNVKEATVDCIRYETSDISLAEEEYGGIKVTGRVENTSGEDGSMVYVAVFLYDGEGSLLGQDFTILDGELKAGDKMGFAVSGFGNGNNYDLGYVASYEIFAYPTQFQF